MVSSASDDEFTEGEAPTEIVNLDGIATRTPSSVPRIAAGVSVGRFVLTRLIGRGGMGCVYQAHDPELDRPVALKFHPADRRERERLQREAQALAALAHPNIIAVYDVGSYGDQFFIAMELIEGASLRAWARRERQPWRSVLEVFLAAGEGLWAAHRAGLIHRDFKPDNVLIGNDGRVRVIDFGLARSRDAVEEWSKAGSDDDKRTSDTTTSTGRSLLTSAVTVAGQVMGTPAYMAPELHRRRRVDARVDQFAFGVSLYEVLYGRQPFSGGSSAQLREAIREGRIEPPPRESKVPRWLLGVVRRMLAADPERRYPTMADALAALRSGTARRRRIALVGAGTLSLSMGVTAAWLFGAPEADGSCRADPALFDGVWDATIRGRLETAMHGRTEVDRAAVFERISTALDRHTGAWLGVRAQVCATASDEGSVHSLDHRMQCLDARRSDVRALTRLLAEAGPEVPLGRIEQVVANLAPPASCLDDERRDHGNPLPDDPALRSQAVAIYDELASVVAQDHLGLYAAAAVEAERVVADAEALGFAPLVARAKLRRAMLSTALGRHGDAEVDLRDTVDLALANRDDFLAAHTSIQLIWILFHQSKLTEALRLRDATEAAIARAGNTPWLGAELRSAMGAIHYGRGDIAAALVEFEAAVPLYERTEGPDSYQVGRARANLSSLLLQAGRADEALEQATHALRIARTALGNEHPDVANAEAAIAAAHSKRGDRDAALQAANRALSIRETALGTRALPVAQSHETLGALLGELERWDEASAHYETALGIKRDLQADDVQIAEAMEGLGRASSALARHDLALEHLSRALTLRESALGPDHPSVIEGCLGLARAHVEAGDRATAERYLGRAEQALDGLQLASAQRVRLSFAAAELHDRLCQPEQAQRAAARALEAARGADLRADLARIEAFEPRRECDRPD